MRLLEAALEAAPVEAAPQVGTRAPAAWTAGSVLERPVARIPTQQTRTNFTTATTARPTLRTVLLVWSLTVPALVATGPKAQVLD